MEAIIQAFIYATLLSVGAIIGLLISGLCNAAAEGDRALECKPGDADYDPAHTFHKEERIFK